MFRFNAGVPIEDDGCHRTGRWRYQVVMLYFFVLLIESLPRQNRVKLFGSFASSFGLDYANHTLLLFWHYISDFREAHDSTISSAVSTIPLEITATQ